jgi:hypothetical protein
MDPYLCTCVPFVMFASKRATHSPLSDDDRFSHHRVKKTAPPKAKASKKSAPKKAPAAKAAGTKASA